MGKLMVSYSQNDLTDDTLKKFSNTDRDFMQQHLKRDYNSDSTHIPFHKANEYSLKGVSLGHDSLFLGKTTKNVVKKSLKNNLLNIQPRGHVSAGYEYGILPYVSGDNYPAGGFSSNGNVSFLLMSIPLEVTYHYSTIKNAIGINNYFRISFDTERYKEQLNKEQDLKSKLKKQDLGKLKLQQQQLLKKIEWLNYRYKYPDTKLNIDTSSYSNFGHSDSVQYNSYSNPLDTLHRLNQPHSAYLSTLKKDSIGTQLGVYKAKYDSINQLIAEAKRMIDGYEKTDQNASSLTNPYLTKVQQLLSGIKKFEIGLCHPTYSQFLINNVPLQGINIEYSRNNNFFAITYGTTINNLLFNTNSIQGTMESARNLYNYFDFGNLDAGRKILVVKGGIGAKDGNHFYVGALTGKGRVDYLQLNQDATNTNSISQEMNLVLELDARYNLSKKLSFDFAFGKSSVQNGDLTQGQYDKAFNEIFSDHRSNAFLIKVNSDLKKTNTKLTFSSRWIDPFFRSFGVGFLRSDNLRYELKLDQYFTKNIRYTIAYRKEEDNLLKLYTYKNTLQSINNSLNVKISRKLNLRLIYVPLFRRLETGDFILKDRNHISSAIITYTPKFKKITAMFNLLYSKYLISGDSVNINFENFTYTHSLIATSGFRSGMNLSWFRNSLSDTVGSDTYFAVIDAGYTAKKGHAITVGAKLACRQDAKPQYGFLARVKIKIYKSLSWEAEAEKILIGDYYNSFIDWKIRSFPYYLSSRLTLNF